jgi:hypothetical protein
MWQQVKQLQPNLSFSQKLMEEAFGIAGKKCGESKWARALTENEMKTWKVSIAKQFRTMARHICQSSKASWYKKMFGEPAGASAETGPGDDDDEAEGLDDAEEGGEEESPREADCEESADDGKGDAEIKEEARDEEPVVPEKKKRRVSFKAPDWVVKFDPEIRNAFRVSLTDPIKKEWSKMTLKDGCPFPFATFEDGSKHEVTAVSAEAFAGMLQKSTITSAVVWTGTRDGDSLKVVKKKDHSLLMALYCHQASTGKKYMICMMAVKYFGPEDQAVSKT